MYKLNLEKGPTPVDLRPMKPLAAGVLLFMLVWQGGAYYQRTAEIEKKQAEIGILKNKLEALKEKKKTLAVVENFEMLNGAIGARNEWLRLRGKSPAIVLAKLEKERPGAVELKSFESSDSGGTIRMIAGDMDTASRYMNAVFGNNNVRLATEERVRNGIIAVCTWTE